MSDNPRRISTTLVLVTVLIVGLIGTPSVRADDGLICDSDSQDVGRATPTAFDVIQILSSTAFDWVQQTLNQFRDGFAWVRSYVRALAGIARV